MAVVHGISGSWKSVRRLIGDDLPNCSTPEQLAETIETLAAGRAAWADQAAAEVEQVVTGLRSRLPALEQAVQTARDDASRRVAPHVGHLASAIRRLGSSRIRLLRWFNSLVRIPPLQKQLEWFKDEPDRCSIREVAALDTARSVLERLETAPASEIAARVGQREARLARLRAAQVSTEHAGALAEFRMAAVLLSGLPNNFHVFHDVNVESATWVYSDGEHRRSAQIDHVIVGPGGVFVVETKLWSKTFAATGQYHNPYRQVHWAGKLLHLVLSDECSRKVRVREIIATSGSLPPKPTDSYAKVLSPAEVPGYVKWFKPELDPDSHETVIAALSGMC